MSRGKKKLNYEQQLDKDGNLGPALVMVGEDLDEIPTIDNNQSRRVIGVNVSNNKISELSVQLKGLKKLEFLILSGNLFTTLPPMIGQLASLRSLNLSNNQLSTLPEEMEDLDELQELILDSNKFDVIPPVLFKMPRLRELHMQHNNVQVIPPETTKMVGLRILVLDYNKITTVPAEVGQMKLQELWVQHNKVETSPDDLKISKLKLHDNPIDPIDQP
ncbi:leucine-rich repeat protein soc-2-like [Patiria miniata]|uniref:Uncharacterized protein n=1 Tax=Patiria miniata TaxID=46514 RepID=A0A914BAP1_PATMI|nr:leucine-rich repeat protein soc-2-like [Patiria miniata]XP_038072517.1 leucine-rich repeat protein soc-2-like [Patiria miniata]